MRRRTFLGGAALAAASAALLPLPSATAATTTTVTSLDALQKAIDKALPGDRIVVADGTYTVPAGKAVTVSGRNGTSAAPITIVSQSRGGAVLKGERSFVLGNSSHVTLSGFTLRQSVTLEVPATCTGIRLTRNTLEFADDTDLDWVVVRGDDTKVDRNRFRSKTTAGCYLVADGPGSTAMAQRLQVLRNHFSDHSYSGGNGGEPIRLGVSSRALSSAHGVVEYNLFERCDGDPEAISVKSSDNTVRYNTIRDSVGGIVLRHGNRTTVEGNHLLGGVNGLRLYGNDHVVANNYLYALTGRALVIGSGSTRDHHAGETADERRGNDACDRTLIVHNTLLNNRTTLSGDSGTDRPHLPQDVSVADNLLVAQSGGLVQAGLGAGVTWRSNLLWGAALPGDIPSSGYTRADPLLRLESDGVHRLSPGSPAIGAASSGLGSVTLDLDGHARGAARDTGADQYSVQEPLRRPLTAADVGPNAA
ncbi:MULTISPECIES: polysaccharide lyase 6 family protein [Streptomyces]|uniref:polysaccharide lyase 6 family protein n=1 Tax=Streptomyces TaxID=1883 RepID=UPI0029AAA25C|nr:polysaccharide lyase 6 family protein [Streptomyces sp. ND04-05B]MDX3060883.1 polysaccharide lyase 6 family protein [Streptomyces sp. ND04-05B]